jgi:hypothetical protein
MSVCSVFAPRYVVSCYGETEDSCYHNANRGGSHHHIPHHRTRASDGSYRKGPCARVSNPHD